MEPENNFGLTKVKPYYESRLGKPLVIHFGGSSSKSGIVQKIEDEFLFLSPYFGNDYSTGKPVAVLREGLATRIRLDTIVATDEVTAEELEGFCKYTNQEYADKEAEKISKKI